jgi:hypothetical protein
MLSALSFLCVFVPPVHEINQSIRARIQKYFKLVFKVFLLLRNSNGSLTNMEWAGIGQRFFKPPK